jgi:hypothetical protein
MMTAKNGDVGIILTKDNKTTRAFVLRDGVWTESNNEIEYKPLLQSSDYNDIYVTPPELIADTIGFTEWFKNDREETFIMKVKKTTNSRTRGARLTDISLKKLISHINDVLGETKYNIINIRDYLISSKEKLEVLLEIILRDYNDRNKNDKHWYLNNEQGIINKIVTLSKKN